MKNIALFSLLQSLDIPANGMWYIFADITQKLNYIHEHLLACCWISWHTLLLSQKYLELTEQDFFQYSDDCIPL